MSDKQINDFDEYLMHQISNFDKYFREYLM